MQQPPFYASYQMGSHDPRMLPPQQQYGGQPFPLANPPPVSSALAGCILIVMTCFQQGAPPFPPYFGAVPPYAGAPPPQPFVASSVPPNPYAVPPQTGAIPPLLPPAVTSTQSETTTSGKCLMNETNSLTILCVLNFISVLSTSHYIMHLGLFKTFFKT